MRPPVGIGLRHPHYAEVLETRPALDFLEVHSENFFGDGGAALAVLAEARGHYAISLHGVGLALGSAAGIDAQHLAQLARLVERIEPVRVSDHACFARGLAGGAPVHAADLLPIPFNDAALDVLELGEVLVALTATSPPTEASGSARIGGRASTPPTAPNPVENTVPPSTRNA